MRVRFAVAPHGASLAPAEVVAFGDALEASAFDAVWLSDVPLGPTLDPLLGLALIAGRTSRLKLGANVVPLGHNPFLLAKRLAQLDQLSGGRLLLSFVQGVDQPGEREALGALGSNRGAVIAQMLELMRSWWAGAEVDYHGNRWSFTSLPPAARPIQDPLEIWLGGRGPKTLELIGRIADGWLGSTLTPDEAHVARERIQASAERAGRQIDPEHFGLSIAYVRAAPQAQLLKDLRARRPDADPLAFLPAGAQRLRSLIERYVQAGLSKFVLRPAAGSSSWEEELEWLGDAILDLQT
jgi:probable F420-dependent oxidoreductase